ncbi:hypothetical protein J3A83DRAFT_4369021 [Scleroderma citrinum]
MTSQRPLPAQFEKLQKPVCQVLNEANIKKEDIEEASACAIISTRIPKISEDPANADRLLWKGALDPDEAVAYGVVVHGVFSLESKERRSLSSLLIARNAVTPTRKGQTLSTAAANHPTFPI